MIRQHLTDSHRMVYDVDIRPSRKTKRLRRRFDTKTDAEEFVRQVYSAYQRHKVFQDRLDVRQYGKGQKGVPPLCMPYQQYVSAYSQLTWKAKKRGLALDLSLNEYIDIRSLPCHYCGRPFQGFGYGLDRLDSVLGYTLANTVACCAVCNTVKGQYHSATETKIMIAARDRYRNNLVDDSLTPGGSTLAKEV